MSDSFDVALPPKSYTSGHSGVTFRLLVNGLPDTSNLASGEALLKHLLHPSGPLSTDIRQELSVSLASNSLSTVVLVQDLSGDPDADVRFFDSVKLAQFLWVRATLLDGQIIEGLVRNCLEAFTAQFMVIYPLDSYSNTKCILIAAASLADLQIVSTR